jgi:hypothetical protein
VNIGGHTKNSRGNGRDELGEDVGQHVHSACQGGISLDSLEIDRYIVGNDHGQAKKHTHIQVAVVCDALCDQMKGNHGVFASPIFPRQKDDSCSASTDEKSNDP